MLLASLACAREVRATTKYAAEFLSVPVGARAVGMGGAFTAVSDDATSPWWNPAGMVFLVVLEPVAAFVVKHGVLPTAR